MYGIKYLQLLVHQYVPTFGRQLYRLVWCSPSAIDLCLLFVCFESRQCNMQSWQGFCSCQSIQTNARIVLDQDVTPSFNILSNFGLTFYPDFLIFCWPCISIYLFININKLDALNCIISLFQASTCFEHMCSSSGGQNCIIQSLISSHLYVWWYQRLYNKIFALLAMSTCARNM